MGDLTQNQELGKRMTQREWIRRTPKEKLEYLKQLKKEVSEAENKNKTQRKSKATKKKESTTKPVVNIMQTISKIKKVN